MTPDERERRWDIHTERQLSASKAGATAVTVLNSGSWLALLSQAGKLSSDGIGLPIISWGLGAFLGTMLWLFIYRATVLQWHHDLDSENTELESDLNRNNAIGYGVAIASLVSFFVGVITLGISIW